MLKHEKWILYGNDSIANSLATLKNKDFEKIKAMWGWTNKYFNFYHKPKNERYARYPKWLLTKIQDLYYVPMKTDAIRYDFNWTLREWQQKVVEQCWKTNLIIAPTGRWKSWLIAGLIKKNCVKTLIVCPKKDIARWLIEKFTEIFWESKVWLFDSKKIDDGFKDIMVIVWPSFNKYYKELNGKFGMLVIDEAHMGLTSKLRIESLCCFQCDYQYWLTATPIRDEVSDDVFDVVYGERIVVEATVNKPTIKLYKYDKYIRSFLDWHDLMKKMREDKQRFNEMKNIVIETMKGRTMGIIFCDTHEMVDNLVWLLQWEIYAESYTGKSKDREDILNRVENNNGVMVYPPLDTGFYFIPNIKFSAAQIQMVGRILRTSDWKKKPLLVDFADMTLKKQNRERYKTYKEIYWEENILDY